MSIARLHPKQLRVPLLRALIVALSAMYGLTYRVTHAECLASSVLERDRASPGHASTSPALPVLTLRRQLVQRVSFVDIHSPVWAVDGSKFAAYVNFGGMTARVWTRDGELVREFDRRGGYQGNGLAFADGGRELVTPPASDRDQHTAFTVFDVERGTVLRKVEGPNPTEEVRLNAANLFVVSPDQSLVAVIYAPMREQPVALYSTRDWSRISDLDRGAGRVTNVPVSLAFSPDSRLLAVGHVDGSVLIYRVTAPAAPTLVARVDAFVDVARAARLAFSPDNTLLAVGAGASSERFVQQGGSQSPPAWVPVPMVAPKPVRVFRVADGRETASVAGLPQPIRAMEWLPHSAFLAIVADDRHLRLWDACLPSAQPHLFMAEHRPWSLAFSPDGSLLVLGEDDTLALVDIR